MKIGIVSDSHGKAHRLRAALDALAESGAEAVVHCGDVGNDECMKLLGSFAGASYAVAGNMDRNIARLKKIAVEAGVKFSSEVIEIPLGNDRYLVATHSHDDAILAELIVGEQFPYVCYGHTHRFRDQRIGAVRVINPGALAHPRKPHHPTAAILDTEADTLDRIDF